MQLVSGSDEGGGKVGLVLMVGQEEEKERERKAKCRGKEGKGVSAQCEGRRGRGGTQHERRGKYISNVSMCGVCVKRRIEGRTKGTRKVRVGHSPDRDRKKGKVKGERKIAQTDRQTDRHTDRVAFCIRSCMLKKKER